MSAGIEPAVAASAVPKKRYSFSERLTRIVELRLASEMIGSARLAEALGVAPRTLRAYLGADRGIGNETLTIAAAAMEARAMSIAVHAAKLRALAAGDGAA